MVTCPSLHLLSRADELFEGHELLELQASCSATHPAEVKKECSWPSDSR